MTPGSSKAPLPSLPDRYRRLLASVVREYIDHGEPVSSLWLATHSALGVSSATLRNMLAFLEQEGYLQQPHTSAGRIPTDLAYRTYVDMLLEARRRPKTASQVEARLRRAVSVEEVLSDVSHELSRASSHVGFAIAPPSAGGALRRIDFVSLGRDKVLVVLVATNGHVSHKVVETEVQMTPEELVEASNYLNVEFHDLPLHEIRSRVIERLNEDRIFYDALLARTLSLAKSTLGSLDEPAPLFVHGASSLIDNDSQHDPQIPLGTLRTVLEMIEEKHLLVQLLNQYIDGAGLTVVIGAEHSTPDLHRFSLIASTYGHGDATGTVGVIGPTRMRYSKAIAAVDSLSMAVARVLHDQTH